MERRSLRTPLLGSTIAALVAASLGLPLPPSQAEIPRTELTDSTGDVAATADGETNTAPPTIPDGGAGHPYFHTDRNYLVSFVVDDLADPGGTVTGIEVDWGEGTEPELVSVPDYETETTSVIVGHSYPVGGAYDVTLTAIDNAGARSPTKTVYVHVAALAVTVARATGPDIPEDEVWLDVDFSGSQFVTPATQLWVGTDATFAQRPGPLLRVRADALSGELAVGAAGLHPVTGEDWGIASRSLAYDVTGGPDDPPDTLAPTLRLPDPITRAATSANGAVVS